jgi:hypothetical protein
MTDDSGQTSDRNQRLRRLPGGFPVHPRPAPYREPAPVRHAAPTLVGRIRLETDRWSGR